MASRRQGANPWARLAAGRGSPQEAEAGAGWSRCPLGCHPQLLEPSPCLVPVHLARPEDPALRSTADMCATRMPPLAHIFRGTFVHSTWTCPMEVLRDHLLGVSDSGKVSGRVARRTPTGGRTGGRGAAQCAAEPGVRSGQSERRGSGVILEFLILGESQETPGSRVVGRPGTTVLPEAGSRGRLTLVRQPFRLQEKGERGYTLAHLKRSLITQKLTSSVFADRRPARCLTG